MIEAKPENLIGDRAYDSDHWMSNYAATASLIVTTHTVAA
jgi:hypothetical protein